MTGLLFVQPTVATNAYTFLNKGNVTSIPTTPPLSLFARINPTSTGGPLGLTVVIITRMPPGFGGVEQSFRLTLNSNGTIAAVTNGAGFAFWSSTHPGPYTLNTDQSAGAVFASTTSRLAYYNGTAGTLNTEPSVPAGLEDVLIGTRATSSVGAYAAPYDGCMTDACIWNVALTAQNMLDLHNGATPETIQPSGVALWVKMTDYATRLQAFAWTGAAIVQITDMIENFSNDGEFDDCVAAAASTDTGRYNRVIGFA